MLSVTSAQARLGQVENRRGAGRVSMENVADAQSSSHLLLSLSSNGTFSTPRK
jgi:hypothetical protein